MPIPRCDCATSPTGDRQRYYVICSRIPWRFFGRRCVRALAAFWFSGRKTSAAGPLRFQLPKSTERYQLPRCVYLRGFKIVVSEFCKRVPIPKVKSLRTPCDSSQLVLAASIASAPTKSFSLSTDNRVFIWHGQNITPRRPCLVSPMLEAKTMSDVSAAPIIS